MKGPVPGMRVGLTFDDVLLVPKFSKILSRKDVDTSARFSTNIELKIPVVSANMDTVTESAMAIALARLGGIGVIHRFLSVSEQVSEVSKVKRSESLVIDDPFTLGPDATIGDAKLALESRGIGGIVIVGKDKRVLGLVTRRDLSLEEGDGRKVSELMTPRKRLVTAEPGVSTDEAQRVLRRNKIEKLPLVDRSDRLVGLITSKDILKRREYPLATKDSRGRLRVAAAVGVKGDYWERARALVEAEVDALVVDIAHGHSSHALEATRRIKKEFREVDLVAGNVATSRGASDLARAGADAVKVGVGSGSICVTRVVTGFGVPQLSAIMDSFQGSNGGETPIIGDGGIRNPGDVTKAVAAGASTVMVGSLFAGTEESPGPTVLREGARYKVTRGMASMGASIDRRLRESQGRRPEEELIEQLAEEVVPEGVEGFIPYRGGVADVVRQLVGGLRSGMSYCGAKDLTSLRKNAEFVQITGAGLRESLPHDIKRLT